MNVLSQAVFSMFIHKKSANIPCRTDVSGKTSLVMIKNSFVT